jgi:hypothetical protein
MLRLCQSSVLLALALMSGCDMLGIESAQLVAERKEAESRAVGGACRHAGRALEDCFVLNRKAEKAAVFAGWREMNDYMRENKIEEVAPQHGTGTQVAANPATKAAGEVVEPKVEAPAKAAKPGKHES